jgi:negative regulator of sigma E activity
MSEERVSQLSALFDGELPREQAEMVIRRALKDPSTRTTWERYALISACLRSEPISSPFNSVADRVQARLAAEREHNVTTLAVRGRRSESAAAPRLWSFGRGALGGAIAAGVAAVSILLARGVLPSAGDDAGAMLVQNEPAAVGYTTPGENAPAQPVRRVDASLGYYLVAHSEEAASALRSSLDQVHGGVELTEDEISAWR